MKELSPFQTILLVVFGFALFAAVLIFAGVIPSPGSKSGAGGTVTVWGPLPEEGLSQALAQFRERHQKEFTLVYVAKDSRVLEAELVEALATGRGPDLVILPHSSILKQGEKLVPISYDILPERQFVDSFARLGSLYLAPQGILALPMTIDPLVLFYNVDALAGAGLLEPPRLWSEMQGAVKALNVVDNQKNIQYSAVALGKANNIINAKDIFSLLALQAGNPLSTFQDGVLRITLADAPGGKKSGEESLAFFSRFADPMNALYSWNSAMPEARDAFVRNQAAMYFGYASESERIRKQNPQLNLDVAIVPQVSATSQLTYGRMWGVSLVRGSRNPETAIMAAYLLSSPEFAGLYSQVAGGAPAHAGLLRNAPQDKIGTNIYRSAIISRGWLEPDPIRTETLFRQMIEAVQAGGVKPGDALSQTQKQLQEMLR